MGRLGWFMLIYGFTGYEHSLPKLKMVIFQSKLLVYQESTSDFWGKSHVFLSLFWGTQWLFGEMIIDICRDKTLRFLGKNYDVPFSKSNNHHYRLVFGSFCFFLTGFHEMV
jgi:hypothetical protein